MTQKRRVEPRIRVTVRALMRDARQEREICIVDLSTRGVLAIAANPPLRGDFVELRIGRNVLTGHVRWSSQRRFGISLRERVSIATLAEGGTKDARLVRPNAATIARIEHRGGLVASPQWLNRMGEMAALAVIAVCAAYIIMTLTTQGLTPVAQAFSRAADKP